jgi:hypothetical protein
MAKASMQRRLGHEYNFSSEENDMVWIIPNIDDLVSCEGSHFPYIQRLKIPLLRYELNTFRIGPEELATELSESLCDQLLELRVHARAFPIEMLLKKR